MAQTAVDNEKYFGDLDAVVGDGDFGYSMARGFEIVLADWDSFDRTDIGTFLKKIAVVITSRVGGTSGPIWGTAFLRAGAVGRGQDRAHGGRRASRCCARPSRASRSAATRTWGTRRCWTRSCPPSTSWRESLGAGDDAGVAIRDGGGVDRAEAGGGHEGDARQAGRASYTGERSIGTLDAGAVAVAVMFEQVADAWAADE